jgi:hypothetical protein
VNKPAATSAHAIAADSSDESTLEKEEEAAFEIEFNSEETPNLSAKTTSNQNSSNAKIMTVFSFVI